MNVNIHIDINMNVDINIHIDINMDIDIHIIVNMNIKYYISIYLLSIIYSLLAIPYWLFPIALPYGLFLCCCCAHLYVGYNFEAAFA